MRPSGHVGACEHTDTARRWGSGHTQKYSRRTRHNASTYALCGAPPPCLIESASIKSRSSIGRSRWERLRLYHAIHWTNAPGLQHSRSRLIVA
eukprot:1846634-Prymnesium_polylepis.1